MIKGFSILSCVHQSVTPETSPNEAFNWRLREASIKLNRFGVWAALAGFLTGLIGGGFRRLVDQVMNTRLLFLNSFTNSFLIEALISILFSSVMVFLGFWLMRRLAPETNGSGIPQIEGFLDGNLSLRGKRIVPVKFVTGILILGSGMILGREGPTIQMGGGIGQLVGEQIRGNKEQIRILVAASSGAGLAAAFMAPLAGIFFVIEEMHPRFQNPVSAYRAVAFACIMAVIGSKLVIDEPVLELKIYDAPPLASAWIFVLLGISLGCLGYLFNQGLIASLNFLGRLQGHWHRLMGLYIGGLVGLLSCIYFPTLANYPHFEHPIVGGGERTIVWSLTADEPTLILGGLLILRFGLTLLCYGSGSPGGIFAPLLSIGTLFSQGMARLFHSYFPEWLPEPGLLTIAGMGGLVAATVRAPLTAILLTLEITGNYKLTIPLMITILTAVIMAHQLGGKPIYTSLLERILSNQPKVSQDNHSATRSRIGNRE
ncbi:MAG: H(+)/Cl(-) exchange transporter ClcA [Gloeocapsa sp. DLM2.Bin57]|nr:MAG: H(+)/Cl(-) exchange transporter ClcA [Gloeocapsa sp. DLM2.Bin57]